MFLFKNPGSKLVVKSGKSISITIIIAYIVEDFYSLVPDKKKLYVLYGVNYLDPHS